MLLGVNATSDSKNHFLVFLLHSNCLHSPREDSVLSSLHRLTPQALRFFKRSNKLTYVYPGCLPLPFLAFPGLPIFLRRQFNWTSLVRLSAPCVSGGSTTTTIVTQAQAFCANSQPILALTGSLHDKTYPLPIDFSVKLEYMLHTN